MLIANSSSKKTTDYSGCSLFLAQRLKCAAADF